MDPVDETSVTIEAHGARLAGTLVSGPEPRLAVLINAATGIKAARIEKRLIRPRDFGVSAIGHVHPFARRKAAIWPALVG